MEHPNNATKPIKEIRHADLERWSDESRFKSKCPVCADGILLIGRDELGQLQGFDRCIGCGQAFKYLDIDDLRKLDWSRFDTKNTGS